jgi:hypothetical protein
MQLKEYVKKFCPCCVSFANFDDLNHMHKEKYEMYEYMLEIKHGLTLFKN